MILVCPDCRAVKTALAFDVTCQYDIVLTEVKYQLLSAISIPFLLNSDLACCVLLQKGRSAHLTASTTYVRHCGTRSSY